MIAMTCLCGAVQLSVPRPDYIHQCNCTLCSKTGARWGYFTPDQVRVIGAAAIAVRGDKAVPSAEVHFCGACGSTTHFGLTPAMIAQHGDVMRGVNMALADPADLAGIEQRFPDGRAWDGASAEFGYVSAPTIIGSR
ncbi:GFA family protein [Parablastomonas sp. CN1-191]|uniref:GFA family protein n=1 Tax=Parablastomonas sp. CN1-191 TaxID=3400908 RepID=UPI003BF84D18